MKRKCTVLIIILISVMSLSASVFADTTQVTYIGTNASPPTNVSAFKTSNYTLIILNLDAQHNLEKKLVVNLPQDVEAAKQIVKKRFSKLKSDELKGLFAPQLSAKKWGIEKAPAWVFNNGEAVIYGVTDASIALDKWQRWKNKGTH